MLREPPAKRNRVIRARRQFRYPLEKFLKFPRVRGFLGPAPLRGVVVCVLEKLSRYAAGSCWPLALRCQT